MLNLLAALSRQCRANVGDVAVEHQRLDLLLYLLYNV